MVCFGLLSQEPLYNFYTVAFLNEMEFSCHRIFQTLLNLEKRQQSFTYFAVFLTKSLLALKYTKSISGSVIITIQLYLFDVTIVSCSNLLEYMDPHPSGVSCKLPGLRVSYRWLNLRLPPFVKAYLHDIFLTTRVRGLSGPDLFLT